MLKYKNLQPVRIDTFSRGEIIGIFNTLAQGIPAQYLHNRQKPPVVAVEGNPGIGKSLIPEIMIKTWSDNHDMTSIHGYEARHMFLEKWESQAMNPVRGDFPVNGQRTRHVFVNIYRPEEVDGLIEQISDDESIVGGSLFLGGPVGYARTHGASWITATLRESPTAASLCRHQNTWARSITIEVHKELMLDINFQHCWEALHKRQSTSPPRCPLWENAPRPHIA